MISETFNFKDFCNAVKLYNQLEIIDLICNEIHGIKMAHKSKTGSSHLKKGSRENSYCEDLQKLLSTVMNASLPHDLRPYFLHDIGPVIARLSQKNNLFKKIRDKVVNEVIQYKVLKNQGRNN